MLSTLALALAFAVPASADTIRITSGSVVFDGGVFGPLMIAGNRGFTFDAVPEVGNVQFTTQCGGSCDPGTPFSLEAFWSGNDLLGTARVDGRTFDDVGGLISDSSAEVRFTGTMFAPPVGGLSAATRAPFAFDGVLRVFHPESPVEEFSLIGHGIATGKFAWLREQNVWNLNRLEFRFEGADPVPEPATLVLVSMGIAGAAARRRRR
jgi:hypothetical protein